jgi:hypothetical protein
MSRHFLILNGLRLLLLLLFVMSSSQTVKALCFGALLATLVVDVVLYRRQRQHEADEEEQEGIHVPMPPDRNRPRT